MDPPQPPSFEGQLLNAFRAHYHRFAAAVTELAGGQTDAAVIARLGDDLDEFVRVVEEVSTVYK
jgi:hypothetical protein